MITGFLISVLLFVLTNVFFSSAVWLMLIRLDTKKDIPPFQLLIFSLALAPFFTTLILYYLLWLIPGLSPLIYISIIFFIFTSILVINRKQFSTLISQLKLYFQFLKKNREKENNRELIDLKIFKLYTSNISPNYLNILSIVVVLYFGWLWICKLINIPILGHDMLEYVIQAKYFAQHRAIEYVEYQFHPENSFFYVGLHGFSFPLLSTWEALFSEIFGKINNDYYMRSVTGYYAFLIFFTQFYWLKKINIFLALISSIILFLTYGFFITITEYHIDSYRIFMTTASLITLAHAIKYKNNFTLLLLGIFCGAQAFIHSFGVFVSMFIVLSYFIFIPENFKTRILQSFVLMLLILLMGGIHYIMDVFYGTGWIFKEIKFY